MTARCRTQEQGSRVTYGDTVGILLADTLSFGLALLEGVLVLELGTHGCFHVDKLWVDMCDGLAADVGCRLLKDVGLRNQI